LSAIELSSDIGLVAVFVLTANILLGLLLSVRYNPWTHWPHRKHCASGCRPSSPSR